jgi:hypothetical protein
MVEAIEEPNEWREFILSDPSTHPNNESDVEFEFVDGTRISGMYGAGWVWHNDRSPNVQPNSVQKWRYKLSGLARVSGVDPINMPAGLKSEG